jgi:hypothetical protein
MSTRIGQTVDEIDLPTKPGEIVHVWVDGRQYAIDAKDGGWRLGRASGGAWVTIVRWKEEGGEFWVVGPDAPGFAIDWRELVKHRAN